ncbi:MAG: NfeD family protein [Oscillospiraceae bacterium]
MPFLSYGTIWFILFVIFLIAEVVTAGPLVSIWFCFGALAAMVSASAGVPFMVQAIVFLVISIALLIITKPIVKKYLHKKIVVTNADAIIGRNGIVTEKINNLQAAGAVKVDGKIWTARSKDEDVLIEAGAEVTILKIEGVKVIVEGFKK